jgi:hypothetical protein
VLNKFWLQVLNKCGFFKWLEEYKSVLAAKQQQLSAKANRNNVPNLIGVVVLLVK